MCWRRRQKNPQHFETRLLPPPTDTFFHGSGGRAGVRQGRQPSLAPSVRAGPSKFSGPRRGGSPCRGGRGGRPPGPSKLSRLVKAARPAPASRHQALPKFPGQFGRLGERHGGRAAQQLQAAPLGCANFHASEFRHTSGAAQRKGWRDDGSGFDTWTS